MPIRVLIIADTPNWAFAERAGQLRRYQPPDIEIEILCYDDHPTECMVFAKYDLVFVLPTNLVGPLRRIWNAAHIDVPLVASHNSGVGRRHWVLLETLMASDYVIVNNYTCWANMRAIVDEKKFTCCNISNGVDTTMFTPHSPISSRPHHCLWSSSRNKIEPHTASELMDPMGRGDVKGYHVVLEPLQMALHSLGNGWSSDWLLVDTDNGLTREKMAKYYNTGSYLVCASASEGTPNIMLEGAACGCVPVTTPVGNVPELIVSGRNGVIVKRNTKAFWEGLQVAKEAREEMSAQILEDIKPWDWSERSAWFYELFRRCAARDWPKPFTYIDTQPGEI